MNPIKTEAFELALKFVNETNVNIFLTGKAGTGKTTFLKYLKDNPVKNMAVAAPTGVAAINAGGLTLHSLFQLPFSPFIPATNETPFGVDKKSLLSRVRFNSEKINLLNALELLVIDEASMVAAHTVDAIDTLLRAVRHKQAPFGGVQVLFIGDLYQLQPVVKEDEWHILKNYYSSNFFFDSHVLRDNIPVMVELKTIFRQKDESFINILNGLRENILTKEHLELLNKRLKPNFISQDGDGYITLTTHNANANKINEVKLNRLSSASFKFKAAVEGDFPEHINPAEKELVLKKGAQVMFIKNDLEGKRFYNGKIGIVSEISDDEIVVQCDDVKIVVGEHIWENLSYTVDPVSKEMKETILGTFTQYPLRLAWAITIHKSQGLTFDKVVIDSENAFANGQVYVALSRATTLEGLILTSPLNDRFLGPHANLKFWQETKHDEKSLPMVFEKARQDYMRQMLFNVFSFDHLNFPLEKFKKEMEEYKKFPGNRNWLDTVSTKYLNINGTADKFRQQLQSLWNENPNPDLNEKLNTRVAEAAVYFSTQWTEWKQLILDHPLKISTRKESRLIDKLLQEIHEHLIHSLIKIELCKKGFHSNELATWKKLIPESLVQPKSSFLPNEKEKTAEQRSGLYELIEAYRNKIAEETDVLAYMIFSNQAIKNCCKNLPGDKASLLNIVGFGKQKVKEYGDEVLRIIHDYCAENNIPLNFNSEKSKSKGLNKSTLLSPTVKETIELFNSGKKLSEICTSRNLAESTIEGHLAIAIKNKLINIEQLLKKSEIESISEFFPDGTLELKAARIKSDGKVPFGKLRMVQAWLMANKK